MVTEKLSLPQDFSLLGTEPHVEKFKTYVSSFKKQYLTKSELLLRYQTFKESLAVVEATNNAGLTYTLEMNKFADWTWEEFKSKMLGSAQNCSATRGNHVMSNNVLPSKVDWRDAGIVGPIKNQGGCGSCWTFSTTGSLEAAYAQAHGEYVSLSEQQLVDCAGQFNNFGCGGGLPSQAFEYIIYNGGLDTEEAYPYTHLDQECKFKASAVGAKVKAVVNITEYDEAELTDAVAFVRPVSIAYQVVSDFRLYKSGVYTSTACKSDPLSVNHAVVAVGFDTESLGLPHFIVRNSWGADWGVHGYFNIEMGKNMCGIATCASYPVVA